MAALMPKADDETREFAKRIRAVCVVTNSLALRESGDDYPNRYFCESAAEGRILVYGEGTCHGDVVRVDVSDTHLIVWHTRRKDSIAIPRPVLFFT